MAVGKAILVIGIAVAIILFMGPLGTLGPSINDFLNIFNPTGDTSDTTSGTETSDGALASNEGSQGGLDGRGSEKGLIDDGKAGEQTPGEGKDSDGDGVSDEEKDRVNKLASQARVARKPEYPNRFRTTNLLSTARVKLQEGRESTTAE